MSQSNRDVWNAQGKKFALGNEIASGAEGIVYEVSADGKLAAKIYHQPLSADRVEKIRVMSRMATVQICNFSGWPVDLLHDRSGRPIGLLMPKFSGRHDIHRLYSPKSRRADFERADWRFLIRTAANAARIFGAIHGLGCVIGDVNERSVLVGQDATVRLIDCDSFQVVAAGRRYMCEVGVETFTPPELQGKSFKSVVRTENHDNFGLGVLIFLLLFMGRHPFAGRYLGGGDMPIPLAIAQHRFAYGVRRSDVNMERPPGTPPLTVVGDGVSTLFELAFSKQLVGGGRPTAQEWATELGKLEVLLRQCTASASHWYLRTVSTCPWCQMEASTGVSLFGFTLPMGSLFNLDSLWREVEALADPGAAPALVIPKLPPSSDARTVGRNGTTRNVISGIAALLIAGFAASGYAEGFAVPLFGLALVAFFVVRSKLGNSEGMQRYKMAYQNAQSRWNTALKEWEDRAGPSEFRAKKSALVEFRRQWLDIPSQRLRMLDQLKQRRRERQLEHFLDQFQIDHASIENVGPSRKKTLESYGVETAADVSASKIEGVPGFGPKLRANLLAWREKIEGRFIFDPTKGVDTQDIAKVEHEIATNQKGLQTQLTTGLAELRAVLNRIGAVRRGMRPQLEAALRDFAQAKANHAVATRT